MSIPDFIFTNVWLFFIPAVVLDALHLRTRSKKFIQRDDQSPIFIKVFFGLALLGGKTAMIMMWSL